MVCAVLAIIVSLPRLLRPPRPVFRNIYATREMSFWPRWIMTPPRADKYGNVAWMDRESNVILLASDLKHADRADPLMAVFHLAWDKQAAQCSDDSGKVLAVVTPDARDVIIHVFSGDRGARTFPLGAGISEQAWRLAGSTNMDVSIIDVLRDCGVRLEE